MSELLKILKPKEVLIDTSLLMSPHIINAMKTYEYFKANPNAENSHIKYYTNRPRKDDCPVIVNSKEEMYDVMRSFVRRMSGLNFVLGMQTDDGVYQVWPRENQPCQGGEMRKYKITHDDCTRPEDFRPEDLEYPFPDGKPLAVGFGYQQEGCGDIERFKALYLNDQQPLIRAFTTPTNVEVISDNEGNFTGFIVLDADLSEPTALVKIARGLRGHYPSKEIMYALENGVTPQEIMFFKLIRYTIRNSMGFYNLSMSSNYSGNVYWFDAEKFFKGGIDGCRDLTGGVLGNRIDYNRPKIDDIFKGKDVNIAIPFNKVVKNKTYTLEEVCKSFIPEFRIAVAEEIKNAA